MKDQSFADRLKLFRRNSLQLTQAQFALLVGMGVASINRYENGAPPSPAHTEYLNSVTNPEVLKSMLSGKEKLLGVETHGRLLKWVKNAMNASSLEATEQLLQQEKDKNLTGNRQFELERLKQMVIFFTQTGEWKTKLNKLLFYTDFLAYRILKKSISGTRYVKGHYGPIPDRQEQIYAGLLDGDVITEREEYVGPDGVPSVKLVATSSVPPSLFTYQEKQILRAVKNIFASMNASEIADYSHEEAAYKEPRLGEAISYSYASKLRELPGVSLTPRTLADLAREAIARIPEGTLDKSPTDAASKVDEVLYGGSGCKK